jgi:hypothetical protein
MGLPSSTKTYSTIDDDGNNQDTRKNNQPIRKPNGGEVGMVVCIDWQVLFLHFPLASNVQDGRASCVTQQRKDSGVLGAALNEKKGSKK